MLFPTRPVNTTVNTVSVYRLLGYVSMTRQCSHAAPHFAQTRHPSIKITYL